MSRESPVPQTDDRHDAEDATAKPDADQMTSGTRPAVQLEDKRTRRVSPFTMQMLANRPSMPPAGDIPADPEAPPSGRITQNADANANANVTPPDAAATPAEAAAARTGGSTTTKLVMVAVLVMAFVAAVLWTRGMIHLPR